MIIYFREKQKPKTKVCIGPADMNDQWIDLFPIYNIIQFSLIAL